MYLSLLFVQWTSNFFDSPRELVLSMMILIVERALPIFVKAAMSNNLIVFYFLTSP